MSITDLDESNDLFWALVKYAENVEESIKQLDDINVNIYPALIELEEDHWENLRKMRDRLAHSFWNIDSKILWSTVTEDFRDLKAILATTIVSDVPVKHGEKANFVVDVRQLLSLQPATVGLRPGAGQSLILLSFAHSGEVGVYRMGLDAENQLTEHTNIGRSFSIELR